LHPAVAEFRDLIDTDPIVRMYLNQMISQTPQNRQYGKRHLQSVPQLLRLINDVLGTAPEYGESMVMTPLGAILDWTMGTPAGFAAYRDRRINAKLKKILNAWCEFLDSPTSLYVLNDSPTGWMSEAAARTIGIEQFQYDPPTSTGALLVRVRSRLATVHAPS
jgi:phosphatidylserine decarboxylase